MEKRYFTVDDANQMIPYLEAAFRRILQMRAQIETLYTALEDMDAVPHDDAFELELDEHSAYVLNKQAMLKGLMAALRDEIEGLHEAGCLVKGLDDGLVDWYARHQGRDVLLCWKLGEKRVTHWHDIHAGFSGRRPIAELEQSSTA